jgi:hypothetical protein
MAKSKIETLPPQRTNTHRIDTRAVRLVISRLPEDCLVRSLEERDYGIDLQLELFDGNFPSGNIAFVQVKGQEDSFKNESKITDFPVKTILYARMFNAPFFIFFVSLKDAEVRFIWLQKYIDTTLPLLSPNWETQQTVTIEMPEQNTLEKKIVFGTGEIGEEKFLNIIKDQAWHRVALEFLSIEDDLWRFVPRLLRHDLGAVNVQYLCSRIYRLLKLTKFFEKSKLLKPDSALTILHKLKRIFLHVEKNPYGYILARKHRRFITVTLRLLSDEKYFYLGIVEMHRAMMEAAIKRNLNLGLPLPY